MYNKLFQNNKSLQNEERNIKCSKVTNKSEKEEVAECLEGDDITRWLYCKEVVQVMLTNVY